MAKYPSDTTSWISEEMDFWITFPSTGTSSTTNSTPLPWNHS